MQLGLEFDILFNLKKTLEGKQLPYHTPSILLQVLGKLIHFFTLALFSSFHLHSIV